MASVDNLLSISQGGLTSHTICDTGSVLSRRSVCLAEFGRSFSSRMESCLFGGAPELEAFVGGEEEAVLVGGDALGAVVLVGEAKVCCPGEDSVGGFGGFAALQIDEI